MLLIADASALVTKVLLACGHLLSRAGANTLSAVLIADASALVILVLVACGHLLSRAASKRSFCTLFLFFLHIFFHRIHRSY